MPWHRFPRARLSLLVALATLAMAVAHSLVATGSPDAPQPSNVRQGPAAGKTEFWTPDPRTIEQRLCQDGSWFLIGEIVGLEYSTYSPAEQQRMRTMVDITTKAHVRVLANMHGTTPDEFFITYAGGVKDTRIITFSHSPRFVVGEVYFLVVSERSHPDIYGSTTALKFQQRIAEPGELKGHTLPPEAELDAIWTEHCTTGTLFGPFGQRPTQRYLPLLSDSQRRALERLCEHY